jgi:hypothetical protein
VTVFKAKQLKGKLIFSYEEEECDIYVGLFGADASKNMI